MAAKKIVRAKDTLGGRARFEGTRIYAETPCRCIGEGRPWILENYPALTNDDIDAALRWCHRPHRRLAKWAEGKYRKPLARFAEWAYARWGE